MRWIQHHIHVTDRHPTLIMSLDINLNNCEKYLSLLRQVYWYSISLINVVRNCSDWYISGMTNILTCFTNFGSEESIIISAMIDYCSSICPSFYYCIHVPYKYIANTNLKQGNNFQVSIIKLCFFIVIFIVIYNHPWSVCTYSLSRLFSDNH